jgi:putative ABC transport system ATP-binding protein
MGCILRPTSGSVRVKGREVSILSEAELPHVRLSHIGFIFQSFNLFSALTAGENVELGFDLRGISGKKAKSGAAELLHQMGLGEKYKTSPADLSGGQKQRVAIARALAGDPDIILADEPTAALDSHSGRVVIEMLRDLAHKRGRAVVVVTHDSRTLEFGDRIIHIEDGAIRDNSAETRGTPAGICPKVATGRGTPEESTRPRDGGAKQAAEKLLKRCHSEEQQRRRRARSFAVLRMTALLHFSAASKAPPFQARGEKCGLAGRPELLPAPASSGLSVRGSTLVSLYPMTGRK